MGLDSSDVQAWSAVAVAVLTGVLIFFTRKYVKKTGEIVTAQRDAHKIQERYLETVDPKARDTLRRALIQHEADRDAISPHRICKLYGSPQLFASTVQQSRRASRLLLPPIAETIVELDALNNGISSVHP